MFEESGLNRLGEQTIIRRARFGVHETLPRNSQFEITGHSDVFDPNSFIETAYSI